MKERLATSPGHSLIVDYRVLSDDQSTLVFIYGKVFLTYSVPHYKTGFLIFGHLVDYLLNHACYKHTQYIKMITDLY